MTSPQFSLKGRVAAVTGGAGLLGRQHAAALAEAGAAVALGDVDGHAARHEAERVAAVSDAPALGLPLDVTDPQSVLAFRNAVLRALGGLDIVVNNAAIDHKVEGGASGVRAQERCRYPVEEFRRMVDVNVTGLFLTTEILGEVLVEQRRGSVINIASTYGLVAPDPALYRRPDGTTAFRKSPAYPASKGAVLALTRHYATAWGGDGVRVNALSPGGVANGQEGWFQQAYARRTPLGRMAVPTDYRGGLVFLASDASAYMTGANLVIDGGFTAW
ncbi:MAG: SDR family oxidoreductase [Thermoanaerobaculia bacterium]